MLKQTNVWLELISEDNAGMELAQMLDEHLIGGLSCIFQPFARANNPKVLPEINEEDFVDATPVEVDDYRALRKAIYSGKPLDWKAVPQN